MEFGKQLQFFQLTMLSDYASYHLQANASNFHDVTHPTVCVQVRSIVFLQFLTDFYLLFHLPPQSFLQNVNIVQII